MSRFGLRSNSDGFKLSEEKANTKKLCKSAKIALKKVYQKKKKSPLLNNQIESKETSIELEKTETFGEKGAPVSIVCSLPLNRIPGIIEKINATSIKRNTKSHESEDGIKKEELSEKEPDDDDEEDRQKVNDENPQTTIAKTLCLYCDKKFTSHRMQLKHVDKFHTHHRDRRCSGRKLQTCLESNQAYAMPSSSTTSISQQFPGCTFCKKAKQQQITTSTKDLKRLFLHLTECHADKYFGCKACVMRFQNIEKLSKHMQTTHKSLSLVFEDNSKSKDDGDSISDKVSSNIGSRFPKARLLKSQKTSFSVPTTVASHNSTSVSSNTTIIGAEEPILSRLGLTQNRLPNNRKGVRLRRESILPDALLKADPISSSKARCKTAKNCTFGLGDADVVFRVPIRTEIFTCVFDDDFYKEVISNVRNNLLYYVDGKIAGNDASLQSSSNVKKLSQPHICGTLVNSPIVIENTTESMSEIHAATNITAATAFPTLLTANQYGGDVVAAKIRRPHTKHSWKWKWDSVKKFKLISEGGKIVKKMKEPMLGLRDLSKLDMWTQLTMRQKHSLLRQRSALTWHQLEGSNEIVREEKQRLNEQLNLILDMRLLPHIILEQNEQAIIKLENEEFGITCRHIDEDCADSILGQTFADEHFLSVLHLLPFNELHTSRSKIVLSGEWARPRCYLCMCCGLKFEKLKSLEEHKMFRHSHILSMHYEVVGRELLAGNLLRHLFIPKRALSRYGSDNSLTINASRRFAWCRGELGARSTINITAEEESSDSIQSILNSCTTHNLYSNKNSSAEDCDTDTKTALDINNAASPSHSMQSSSSSVTVPIAKTQTKSQDSPLPPASCTKCKRKCNGVLDLYRHMLDCSGDYIWSMAKKRKYRYYCGSKKRRPCNKYNFADLRKSKSKSIKTQITAANDTEESSNCSKTKTPPRQRPSDAESIKKMLENLPPKRVCKKIFPTVTKTKKTKKSKLIAKHKMFNSQVLRKTRARQITKGTKFVSKAKNQFSGKSVNKKVLTAVLKHSKKVNSLLKKNSKINSASKTILNMSRVVDSNKSHQKDTFRNQKDRMFRNNEIDQHRFSCSVTTTRSPINNSATVLNRRNLAQVHPDAETEAKVFSNHEKEQREFGPEDLAASLHLNKKENPASALIDVNIPNMISDCCTKATSPQIESSNSSKKRSKKINDCIAMLTGKLEEKLKTEQIVNSNGGSNTEVGDKIVSRNEKKNPKRKTFSRRIIKPDILSAKMPATQSEEVAISTPGSSVSVSPVMAASNLVVPSCGVEPTAAVPMTVVPNQLASNVVSPIPVVPMLLKSTLISSNPAVPPTQVTTTLVTATPVTATPVAATSVIPLPVAPIPVTSYRVSSILIAPSSVTSSSGTSATLAANPVLAAATVAPTPITFTPASARATSLKELTSVAITTEVSIPVPMAPPPPIPVTVTMLPKLPLFIPMDKLKTSTGAPFLSLPLSVQVPVESVRAPRSQTVRILAPPSVLQKVSTTETLYNNATEPLNLSSVKCVLKNSVLLDPICGMVHRPGIPARRQTICGFEAQNLLSFDEMEPLDLSKKSKNGTLLQVETKVAQILSAVPLTKANESIGSVHTPISLPSEAVLNKQFYSNLDLLKIPQVRNPVYVSPSSETPVHNTLKSSTKKRSINRNNVEVGSKPLNVCSPVKAGVRETISNKKDCSKNKPVQKMDEEVINHIDDAINSVINAVKANLPDNDEDKLSVSKIDMNCRAKAVEVSESNDQTTKDKGVAVLYKNITAQKRCVRSKTLDCRPVTLNTYISTSKLGEKNVVPSSPPPQFNLPENSSAQIEIDKSATDEANLPALKTRTHKDVSSGTTEELIEKVEPCEPSVPCTESSQTGENSKLVSSSSIIVESNIYSAKPVNNDHISSKNAQAPVAHEANENLITEENISNINNTSSGFFSSGPSESILDAKKKQRRRRKNELAAIVADQLLESFKIDKARRDNLKKLENLAYEKSEDLLLTGMLLMSSTKRNASSNFAAVSTPFHEKCSAKSVDNAKRQKQDQSKCAKSKSKSQEGIRNGEETKNNAGKDTMEKEVHDKEDTHLDARRSKRRPCRRKGKTLDNENISKLKSSLESFSIGIERQISEMEAKNGNVFNVVDGQTFKAVSATATRSSILRPSILSVTLDLDQHSNANSKSRRSENKAVSSRDPRLNKNIHKGEKEIDDSLNSGALSSKSQLHAAAENSLEEICDLEEDNYLTEIAKNVNEKIMAAENEDFAFANDGFELVNDLQDDSNSKYSRPPTSMSVRSAPNFNDDHSNFGSMCDENTNTEVMDMDLDDELSVYTSYSQDVGRGRGRRKRRRRSILLKRRPKKRLGRDLSAEKYECALCKKTFFTANSLTKHNMTLAHVSKVSEQEYLQSKSMDNAVIGEHRRSPKILGLQPGRMKCINEPVATALPVLGGIGTAKSAVVDSGNQICVSQPKTIEVNKEKNGFEPAPRLTLNPDERLFFECCNILKGAETPRISCGNYSGNCSNGTATYTYAYHDKTPMPSLISVSLKPPIIDMSSLRSPVIPDRSNFKTLPTSPATTLRISRELQKTPLNSTKVSSISRTNEQNLFSQNYSAVSQFSAVTNTTSRFKTKAAMKGYENVATDITIQQEHETKSKTVCKLTELAEIALGTEKPNSSEFTPLSTNEPAKRSTLKPSNTPHRINISTLDNQKDCNLHISRDMPKNNETQSSTSSKTIMHSSIIKAAVEEHNKVPSSKIIIPDRPFKNIGLEEKETITFQKPRTTVNLLTDDNSVSTASYSDRDDFDFGSMSCDDDASVKTGNEKNARNNSSDSSSSRATAKTFENKSLIMGRIFKNVSTKAKSTIRMKSIGVQKDQPQIQSQPPKADLNQLFDELRGEAATKAKKLEMPIRKLNLGTQDDMKDKQSTTSLVVPPTSRKTRAGTRKKSIGGIKKNRKDISRLQSELGMTPEEIEKLIDEGQRKSKRRCATNRPKKLIEMWSSDEYEEFLSTKDIIALIEEKEKQEQRRKRKNSVNQPTNSTENKDVDLNFSHTSEMKNRKNTRSLHTTDRNYWPIKLAKDLVSAGDREATAEKKGKNLVGSNTSGSKEKLPSNSLKTVECTIRSRSQSSIVKSNNSSQIKANSKSSISTSKGNRVKSKGINLESKTESNVLYFPRNFDKTNKTGGPENDMSTSSKIKKIREIADGTKVIKISQRVDDFRISDTRQNNHCRVKSKERKNTVVCREAVNNLNVSDNNCGTMEMSEVAAEAAMVKKRNSSSNNISYKSKRKTQSNQSPPRQKRLASEKLYYWSSSSDEDFGRINSSHGPAENFENSGEQYQKHGWIVGDSHKKLVTLLAITKGNKKVDSCGVKRNVSKKKS